AARLFGHRHRQRQGKRRTRHREVRTLRAHRRRLGDEAARRTTCGVRCAETHETPGQRLPALLPAGRLTAPRRSDNNFTSVKSARAFHAWLRHKEKISETWRATSAIGCGRVKQFLSYWCHENVGLRRTERESCNEFLRQRPGKFSERFAAAGGHRCLRRLARTHAAHARPSRRHHQESLHVVELQTLGRQGEGFLGRRTGSHQEVTPGSGPASQPQSATTNCASCAAVSSVEGSITASGVLAMACGAGCSCSGAGCSASTRSGSSHASRVSHCARSSLTVYAFISWMPTPCSAART